LFDEGLEERPNHVEDERLLHEVHLLHAKGHRLLDECEQSLGEARRQGLHLFHRQSLEVHDADHAPHLGLLLQLGGEMYHVEHAEHLIAGNIAGIPEFATVHDEHTTTLLVAVLEHIDHTALHEFLLNLLDQESTDQRGVLLAEAGCGFHLKVIFKLVKSLANLN